MANDSLKVFACGLYYKWKAFQQEMIRENNIKLFVTFSVFGSLIYEGGEKVDIEKLYQEYFSVVYEYVLSISKDPLTAEEITQETFFKALKKIDQFRGESSVKVWLCQIAKNE